MVLKKITIFIYNKKKEKIKKMPYLIRKNPNQDTYKVTNKDTKRVYAYRTKDPTKLIQAIEINKRKSRQSQRSVSKSKKSKKSKKSRRSVSKSKKTKKSRRV